MAKRRCAVKKLRQDKVRHLHNIKIKQELKKAVKKFQALLTSKNLDEAKKLLNKVYSQLDKAAKIKLIHPRTADRKKSRLMRKVFKATKLQN